MSVADSVRSGALIPVAVYGSCGHPDPSGSLNQTCGDPDHFSFGLCDRFSKFAPGGSDCNRAEFFLLRPNDFDGVSGAVVEDLADIRAAIEEVIAYDEKRWGPE